METLPDPDTTTVLPLKSKSWLLSPFFCLLRESGLLLGHTILTSSLEQKKGLAVIKDTHKNFETKSECANCLHQWVGKHRQYMEEGTNCEHL